MAAMVAVVLMWVAAAVAVGFLIRCAVEDMAQGRRLDNHETIQHEILVRRGTGHLFGGPADVARVKARQAELYGAPLEPWTPLEREAFGVNETDALIARLDGELGFKDGTTRLRERQIAEAKAFAIKVEERERAARELEPKHMAVSDRSTIEYRPPVRKARLIGGPYGEREIQVAGEQNAITVNGAFYEEIVDPDSGAYLGGYVYRARTRTQVERERRRTFAERA